MSNQTTYSVPEELLPNVYLLRIPLPNNPLRYVNSYLLVDQDFVTVVDVGFNHPACEAVLRHGIACLGRDMQQVRVLLTHSHPDHIGNLDRIYEPGMQIFAGFDSLKNAYAPEMGSMAVFYSMLLDRMQATAQARGEQLQRTEVHMSKELGPLKSNPPVQQLCEGDLFLAGGYSFEVLHTPGHDAAHLCLYEPTSRTMLVGDHVLQRVTPVITAWHLGHDPLANYLQSLDKVAAYKVGLALPAHYNPIKDVRKRIAALKSHHTARLNEFVSLVREGYSEVPDIAARATWHHPNWDNWALDQKFFSIGETMAHLVYAAHQGLLNVEGEPGTYRFFVA